MSAERDELRELVERLPEEQVPAILVGGAQPARRVIRPSLLPLVGSGPRPHDAASVAEELLDEGSAVPRDFAEHGAIVAAALAETPTIASASNCSPACTWQEGGCWSPGTVIAEVGYSWRATPVRASRRCSSDAVADGDFELIDLVAADARRAASLVRTYSDLPLGTTDATVVAIAERLGATEVATLDRRHFTVVRPIHVNAFTLLP